MLISGASHGRAVPCCGICGARECLFVIRLSSPMALRRPGLTRRSLRVLGGLRFWLELLAAAPLLLTGTSCVAGPAAGSGTLVHCVSRHSRRCINMTLIWV